MSKKLEKVLEYLINNQEDKAKELLHQVFIEKARSIHEELINMEDEDMDLDGDMGDDFEDEIVRDSDDLDVLSDEIEAEETMAEADDDLDMDLADAEDDLGDTEMDMDMDTGDMDSDEDMMSMDDMTGDEEAPAGDGMGSIEDTMGDLEDALAALKAEFEKLEGGSSSEDEEVEIDDEVEGDDDSEEAEGESDGDEEEEKMDESWLAEFDDLEESVSLDNVPAPNEKEVGAGKYASVETNTKSPVAKAPNEMFGAKPVVTGKGSTKSGYERESAPTAQQLKGVKDNRRKKADDGMSQVSKEGNGSAMLNKSQGEPNKKSPLTSSPRK
jgi:hypothetical protein